MIFFTFFPDFKRNFNVNGNSIFSDLILKKYYKKNKDIIINTTLKNKHFTFIKKLFSYFLVFYLIFFKDQKKIFTVMLDNYGFYPHLFFCYFASFFSKLIIYHHSFVYINKKKPLFNLLSSKKITHICISKKQHSILKSNYNLNNSILVENFIFFLNKNLIKKKNNHKIKKIIFFSALVEEKGIYDYLYLAKKLKKNKDVNFYIYGNNCSKTILNEIKFAKENKIIKDYKLNVYGKIKENILTESDILIFPSKHKSETTPIIIDECIDNLIVPICYDIGDIRNQINKLDLVGKDLNYIYNKLFYIISNFDIYKNKIKKLKNSRMNTRKEYLKKLDNCFY